MRTCGKDTAVLIDGGFLRNAFKNKFSIDSGHGNHKEAHISVAQVIKNVSLICPEDRLFRIYYYDATPFDGKKTNPLSNKEIDFKNSTTYSNIVVFQNGLARSKKVAFRKGHLAFRGWKIKNLKDFRDKIDKNIKISEKDLAPALEQKMVDIKIGLDIAWLSMKRIVDRIIIVTSDSDFIPVMKFARKEGMEVILCSIDKEFKKELLEHVDEFMELNLIEQ